MYLKKTIPILAIIAMMSVFMGAMHPASASSTTEVKAYIYNPHHPPGTELGKEITIKRGQALDIAGTVHINGGKPKWYRYIHFNVYNPKGNQIVDEERIAGYSGVVHYKINTKKWNTGTYKLCVIYWGSDNGDYPRADKEITLHII
jgi:hypothetical protein